MDLLQLFEQFDECREEAATSQKRLVIEEILDSENADIFKEIVSFVYNPYRKAHIKVTDDVIFFSEEVLPSQNSVTDADIWANFKTLLCNLETRTVTGHAARRSVSHFFSMIHAEYYDYFVGILNKDLKIGVGSKLLEKYVPELIPKFSVQLCPSKQWDGKYIPNGGWLVSPKIDGIRGVIGPFSPDKTKFYGYRSFSRNGRELSNTEHILEELSGLAYTFHRRESVWPVFDGEFYVHGWELSSSIVSTKKRSHPEAGRLQYHVFDLITYPEWVNNSGKLGASVRDRILANVVKYCSEKVVHVPSLLSRDPEEVAMIAQAYVDDGYEGGVLKSAWSLYEFQRSPAWQKTKPFFDLDVPVSKIVYGKLDNEGNLYDDGDPRATGSKAVRSLVVDVAGIETLVGTGLSHAQRVSYATDPESVLGKTITVRYQRISEDGKLIFPRFTGIRVDK